MLVNRSHADILSAILEATRNSTRPTRIMYSAMITSQQLKEYLNELVGKELVSHDPVTRTYHLTKKGKKYLRLYDNLSRDLK
jgi:predicted transcriptional regulator